MKNILVTGGSGFIGSELTKKLISEGHRVSITSSGNEHKIDGVHNIFYLNLDGLNWNAIQNEKIQVLYHLAANNDTQSVDHDGMMAANVQATQSLIHQIYAPGYLEKIIFASTAAVYGHTNSPTVESSSNPVTIYAQSKFLAEDVLRAFAKSFKVPTICFRYSNVYGLGEQFKGKRASMIYQILNAMLNDKSPELFAFGSQSRDWIYIQDVVRANLLALDRVPNKTFEIYNCSTNISTSFIEIVNIINELTDSNIQPKWIENPYGQNYQNYTCCDNSLIKQNLNFSPIYSVKTGISEMINQL